jgi:hypothetical protein
VKVFVLDVDNLTARGHRERRRGKKIIERTELKKQTSDVGFQISDSSSVFLCDSLRLNQALSNIQVKSGQKSYNEPPQRPKANHHATATQQS